MVVRLIFAHATGMRAGELVGATLGDGAVKLTDVGYLFGLRVVIFLRVVILIRQLCHLRQ
jgi:hypothetical protein